MTRRALALAVCTLVVAAACAGGGESAERADPTPMTAAVPPESSGTATAPVQQPGYEALAAEIALAEDDRSLPPDHPATAIGAYGYSRYVYTNSAGEIVPSLIEGPASRQIRCQELDQICSYQELKALDESGDEIPDYLNMDEETLGELVDQLDQVNSAVGQFDSIDDACAAGFYKSTNQNANMGIHMIDPSAGSPATGGSFDPDRPQMVLFAKEGAERLNGSELGSCRGGDWTGEDGFEPVGAVFNLTLTPDHPDGFAGGIDNWHIHYNTCISRTRDPEVDGAEPETERGAVSRQQCADAGGQFLPIIPSWMMHAYVADGFEAQAGVFSMFNPSIWPIIDTEGLRLSRTVDTDAEVDAPISNFDFGDIEASIGDTIRFSNSDALPHTVTAGSSVAPSGSFDSGVLATGSSWDIAFDEPGSYAVYCALHPDMTATIDVTG